MSVHAFALPVFDCWLVHAPLVRTAALVNSAAAKELCGSEDPPSNGLAVFRGASPKMSSCQRHAPDRRDPNFWI